MDRTCAAAALDGWQGAARRHLQAGRSLSPAVARHRCNSRCSTSPAASAKASLDHEAAGQKAGQARRGCGGQQDGAHRLGDHGQGRILPSAGACCSRLRGLATGGRGDSGARQSNCEGDDGVMRNGRDFAAWIGLVPRQHSTGGKERLGGISKQGDRYLRRLLVIGATAVVRQARLHPQKHPWIMRLLAKKPAKLVAVAVANKMARIAWAIMAKGGYYRAPELAAAA